MKRKIMLLMAAAMCLCAPIPAMADAPSYYEDHMVTDYYMIVQSQNEGVELCVEPGGKPMLNGEKIPNGTPLRITGEKESPDGEIWGYTMYKGKDGYVDMDELAPITEDEAIKAAAEMGNSHEVSYKVTIDTENGSTWTYKGPSEDFGKTSPAYEFFNGDEIYICEESDSEDDGWWGKISMDEVSGWINLEDTDKKAERQGEVVDLTKAEPTATPTPEPTATPTPEPTATPTPEPTATATPEPTATVTPEPTATSAPTATAEPTEEATPTPQETENDETPAFFSIWGWLVAIIVALCVLFWRIKKNKNK